MSRRFSYESMTPPEQAIWREFFPTKRDEMTRRLLHLLYVASRHTNEPWYITARGIYIFGEMLHLDIPPRFYNNHLALLEGICALYDRLFGLGTFAEGTAEEEPISRWDFAKEYPVLDVAGLTERRWTLRDVPLMQHYYHLFFGSHSGAEAFVYALREWIRYYLFDRLRNDVLDTRLLPNFISGTDEDSVMIWVEDYGDIYAKVGYAEERYAGEREILLAAEIFGLDRLISTDEWDEMEQGLLEQFLEADEENVEEEFDIFEIHYPRMFDWLLEDTSEYYMDMLLGNVWDEIVRRTTFEEERMRNG